jgi:drug/metabolite transporter (DMT)-like permease
MYVSVGEQARQSVPTATMTMTLYATAAVPLLGLCLLLGESLGGYSVRDWLLLLALTAGAQLLGHTLINKVLSTTSATVVSLAILLEMPGATLIAAVALGQLPPLGIVPAVMLIFGGIVMVIRYGTRDVPTESSPV